MIFVCAIRFQMSNNKNANVNATHFRLIESFVQFLPVLGGFFFLVLNTWIMKLDRSQNIRIHLNIEEMSSTGQKERGDTPHRESYLHFLFLLSFLNIRPVKRSHRSAGLAGSVAHIPCRLKKRLTEWPKSIQHIELYVTHTRVMTPVARFSHLILSLLSRPFIAFHRVSFPFNSPTLLLFHFVCFVPFFFFFTPWT